MKKTYITPITLQTTVELQKMIAASGNANPGFEPGEETEKMESRRRFSLWDEEDEE